MKSRLMKISSLFLAGVLMFSACEDESAGSTNGDIVGTWTMTDLAGTYTRTVDTDTPISHYGQWNLADAILGAQAAIALQPFVTLNGGDVMTGFPQTSSLNSDGLAASGIALELITQDAKSDSDPATYTLTGTYPTIRTDLDACRTAGAVASMTDQGLYTPDWSYVIGFTGEKTMSPGNFMIERDPTITGEQVLPPFNDGSYSISPNAAGVDVATLKFLDRDGHSDRYAEVKSTWDETADRVVSAVFELPVDPATGAFGLTGTSAAEGYIQNPALAPWSGYLTWYGLNVSVQTAAQAQDVKNPLGDLDGSGTLDVTDMVLFMHADNLAGGGGATALGMPFALLVNSTNPAAPALVDDSAGDIDPSGGAATMAAGGKLTYVIQQGTCFPVDETIDFTAKFERKAE